MNRSVLLLLVFLGACSLAPDYQRPQIETGAGWKQAAATDVPVKTDWWVEYKSATLTQLVPQALQANNDLLAALQRIEQARAAVSRANASFFPQINASAGASQSWRETGGNVTRASPGNAGASISYEVDLFGRLRSAADAAAARAQASQYDYESLRIVTAASVVEAYASALAAADRLRVAQDNLTIANEILDIIEARFREGAASALELSQQKASVASAKAAMASLVSAHDVFVNQLAVLLAVAPQNFTLAEEKFSVLLAPKVTPNLPSALLQQRPDIRRAEADLIAANADIGAARAAFFPSLNLGLDGVLNFNPASAVLSLSAAVLAPIFSGGALEADLTGSQARKEELAANYRQTVLTAFQEVSDALAAMRAADVRFTSLTTATVESRNAYKLARARYDSGSIDFQTLLDTQRTLLQAEDSATQARLEQIQASLNLIKALGGGWKETP